MGKFSAKQRKLRGQGNGLGPHFIQLFHYLTRSTSYHELSLPARALLILIADRYNGSNNGMISLSRREAVYELKCGAATASRAMRELDNSGLVRPTKVGAWRGREATQWRLMWRRCDLTGDLPRKQWVERTPFHQLVLPSLERVVLSDAERAKRYRAKRHENRHGEVRHGTTEGPLQNHRRDARSATEPQNGNSSITSRNSRSATEPYLDIYQEVQRDGTAQPRDGAEPDHAYPDLPDFLRRNH